jgi:hypothetical protein
VVNSSSQPQTTISIQAQSADKNEASGWGTIPFTFTVSRSGDASGTSSVHWQMSPTQAPTVDDNDFSGPTSGTLTWDVGELGGKQAILNVVRDGTFEPDEAFVVTLSNVIGATINPQQASATGVIRNDDASPPPPFQPAHLALAGFGTSNSAGGWSSDDLYPRELADVNGDGLADIVGFGGAGVSVALATGGGNFGPASLRLGEFGTSNSAGGWISGDRFPRELADVNGDGLADIVGFGIGGVTVALATGGGNFGPGSLRLGEFGTSNSAGGWSSDHQFPRELADVNGDGLADIVGFGIGGVTVALATGGGNFAPGSLRLGAFGTSNSAGGWSSEDVYPRELADVNGDGLADIVGFGIAGVTVALATGGGNFGPAILRLGAFGTSNSAGGWSSDDLYPRALADVNGDGLADIIGFGIAGVTVALATGDGNFGTPTLQSSEFGTSSGAGGWTSHDLFPRELADVSGDGRADIIGFGIAGVSISQSAIDLFLV